MNDSRAVTSSAGSLHGNALSCRIICIFCAPADLYREPLLYWVRYWKSHAARNWLRAEDAPIWQRHFWDTQLRRGENYDNQWDYVVANPVRAGLVPGAEDWPFQGSLPSCGGDLEGRASSRPTA
jgi:hypothetical protein